MPRNVSSYRKLFYAQGLESKDNGGQLAADCPFCTLEGHISDDGMPNWFANDETSQWDCKVCKRVGNYYTFLSELVNISREHTTREDYVLLKKARGGIPISILEDHLVLNPFNNKWMFPQYNDKDKLVNVYSYDIEAKTMRGATGCNQHLIGLNTLGRDYSKALWICEGQWDYLTLLGLRDGVKAPKKTLKGQLSLPENILGLPGSFVKKDWYETLRAYKQIIVLGDNDDAGQSLVKKVASIHPRTYAVEWPEGTPDKYDLRDLYCTGAPFINARSFSKSWKFLKSNLVPVEAPKEESASEEEKSYLVDPLPCPDFKTLIKHLKTHFHVTEDVELALATACAVYLSTFSSGEPLWMYVVGPSGSAKTKLIEALKGAPLSYPLSSMTGLHTGFEKDNKRVKSPLEKMNHHCVQIEDFTETLTMSKDTQARIFGELRSAYNGAAKRVYRNDTVSEVDNIRFTIVAGATEYIYSINHTHVGERFLKVRIQSRDNLTKVNASGRAFLDTFSVSASPTDPTATPDYQFRQYMAGFLSQKMEDIESLKPKIPANIMSQLESLAEACAWCQTRITKVGKDQDYHQSHNPGTRLVRLLTKLMIFIGYTLDKPARYIYPTIVQIAKDTVHCFQSEIAFELAKGPKFEKEIARACSISDATVNRRLHDLRLLGVVTNKAVSNGSGRGGAKLSKWSLTPDFAKLCKKAKL